MQIIFSEKLTGKTSMLVSMSARFGYVIVCTSPKEIKLTQRIANKLGMVIPEPITYEKLRSGILEGTNTLGILLDDADVFLEQMCGSISLVALTMTKEESNG